MEPAKSKMSHVSLDVTISTTSPVNVERTRDGPISNNNFRSTEQAAKYDEMKRFNDDMSR